MSEERAKYTAVDPIWVIEYYDIKTKSMEAFYQPGTSEENAIERFLRRHPLIPREYIMEVFKWTA